MSFTDQVRDELAHAPPERDCCRTAEAAAMLRLSGALHVTGDGPGWVCDVGNGAVARRLHSALVQLYDVRPEIEVHQPTPLHGTRYRLSVPQPAALVLRRLGLLDEDGRPADSAPELTAAQHDATAYVRGATMVAGSLSDPRRPAHFEIRVPNQRSATALERLVVRSGGTGARAAARQDEWRVVAKSGAAIGSLLARLGAHSSFLAWDAARLRRELRGEANRATNADQANLSRAAGAAARQVAAIEAVVGSVGWDGMPDDLSQTALARLANPQASLNELGALHDPPVGKATVHRRLARLTSMAEAQAHGGDR